MEALTYFLADENLENSVQRNIIPKYTVLICVLLLLQDLLGIHSLLLSTT
jgi:hypothetical protein